MLLGALQNFMVYILCKKGCDSNLSPCRERKKALLLLLQRTPQQAAEEDEILARAKVIEAKRKAEEAAARGPTIETPPPAGKNSFHRTVWRGAP